MSQTKTNRRTFLRVSAGSAIVAPYVWTSSYAKAEDKNSKLNVAATRRNVLLQQKGFHSTPFMARPHGFRLRRETRGYSVATDFLGLHIAASVNQYRGSG